MSNSDEHRLLQTIRQTGLQDPNSRQELCRRIIDAMDMGETNYLILLAADTYDVPYRGRNDEIMDDASDTVYRYFVCSICPVKAPTLELKYSNEDSGFHSASTGHIALSPELGFLFPAFDDRSANIYNALFYSKNTAQIHQEVIDAVFRIDQPPMSAEEQKNIFSTTLGDTLQKDCRYDVVQSVHEQLRGRIEEHKESKDPQPLTLSVREVGDVLTNSGVPAEKVEAFQQECRKQYGEDAALNPKNIIESGKFQITTPEVKITVAPEYSYMIEARFIDGRRYILIPADDSNETRALLLLAQEGLIELPADASAEKGVTTLDIVDAKGHDVQPLQADTVPAQLANSNPGTVAVINGNYALQAGLHAADALAIEDASGDAAQTYANIIACRAGEENSAKIQALVKALQSDAVKEYIEKTYNGAVVAIF